MTIIRNLKAHMNLWWIMSTISILLMLIPNIAILVNVFNPPNENYQHIREYLLKQYLSNTILLVVGTGILTIGIGVSLAWVMTMYDFPMKRWFNGLLILPLAIPTYIGAYTYHGLFSYTGIIQRFLRNELGVKADQSYFNLMNNQGAIFIFTIFLYPYVYMITKAYLQKQSASIIETARLLGKSPWAILWKVVLPISRGAIVGGVSLVMLEVLNDYGVANYYGIPTMGIAIFKTWFGMGDLDSVIKLSGILMSIIMVILIMEKVIRGRRGYSYTTSKVRPLEPIILKGRKGYLVMGYCLVISCVGFFIPMGQLVYWASMAYKQSMVPELMALAWTSISLAVVTAIIIIILAVVIANYSRHTKGFIKTFYTRVTILGYSIPGAVIAIGVMLFFIGMDRQLYGLYRWFDPQTSKLVLTSSMAILLFAYVMRFLAIGYNPIEAGFEKIGLRFHQVARTLGKPITKTFWLVDMPMIRPAIMSGLTLVFVDVLKELPLTLLLRPFNVNTLATKTYEYANDEMIQEAAIPSLVIILISICAMGILNRLSKRRLH